MINQKINERIDATRVMLILPNGDKHGETSRLEALNIARQNGMDLVQVSTNYPPVCKIMDYGKMLFQKSKQEKHKHHAPQMKEVRFKYKTEDHDLEIKKKQIAGFLAKGHRVLFSMTVKGRERFVAGNAAKEKFMLHVKDFCKNCKMSDIQDGEESYSIVLHPVSAEESTEK